VVDQQHTWESLPHIDRTRLVQDLKRLGLYPGATVLVHSSLSRIGHVDGGAETVVRALLDAVAPDGTVLFPALTGSEADGPERPPHIDVRSTSCWTGRIPQTALQVPWARRSLHPTHSIVAIGAQAVVYTTGHEQSLTPCDEDSPYYRLIKANDLILLLGVDQESNTSLHCIEEAQAVPYHLQQEISYGTVVDENGVEHTVPNRLHLWGWERHFAKIDRLLIEEGAMVYGKVGSAAARLMQAASMADMTIRELRSDPLYLLNDAARRRWIERASENGGRSPRISLSLC
jgi:aminoglycoside 3-N-acetyltransferase